MKAFNPNDKDKLITMSVISEDLPNFFKAISSFDYKNKKIDLSFAKNLVFLYGYATSLDCEYEETKKFFKQELKQILSQDNQHQYSATVEFFDSLSDKLELVEQENRNALVYATLFVYRLYYNYLFLSQNLSISNQESSSSPAVSLVSWIEPQDKIKEKENDQIFNTQGIAFIKSLCDNEDEDQIQKSFVCISELVYYTSSIKGLGITNDEFREMLTHAITGCFLLETDSVEQVSALCTINSASELLSLLQ